MIVLTKPTPIVGIPIEKWCFPIRKSVLDHDTAKSLSANGYTIVEPTYLTTLAWTAVVTTAIISMW